MAAAIISIVHTWTIILALAIITSHSVALFWPRKPLEVPLDQNGLPLLWRNEADVKKDVACVWWGESEELKTNAAETLSFVVPQPPFNGSVSPLSTEASRERRSVA
jgi:hypothetical protein